MGYRRTLIVLGLLMACTEETTPAGLEPCVAVDPLRQPFYGDLHVHTGFSFDARNYGNVLTPQDAYRFARGGTVSLPPLDGNGIGTRSLSLDRPLDFAAVTDHAEFLGEIYACSTPGAPGYDSATCRDYRDPTSNDAFSFGLRLSMPEEGRFEDLCGVDGQGCAAAAQQRWEAMAAAADAALDRSSGCTFTSFVGYEYTNTRDVSNLHRNVIFATEKVPRLPVDTFAAPHPLDLWHQLDAACQPQEGCDVLVLPHNSNLSNGKLFHPQQIPTASMSEAREIATLRARMEPVAEIFQHKGDSECSNGFGDGVGDPLCDFEKLRPAEFEACGDELGSGCMRLWGCGHRYDFLRNVFRLGLAEEQRMGVNPYRLGVIGSTDTHNGTPGYVDSLAFAGHVGIADDTHEERLGPGNVTHDGLINNPGGLAAVWAQENRRASIFDAIRRRETFAVSGPRMRLRFFAGLELPEGTCERGADAVATAGYAGGVPMGGVVSGADAALAFLVYAEQDPDGLPLHKLQIVKGWVDSDGQTHEAVTDVVTEALGEVDEATCEARPKGAGSLCVRWQDPDFDPAASAFYYARVLEAPSCRWSWRQCLTMSEDQRPAGCTDLAAPRLVQQRAWSSPIWTVPAAPGDQG